MYEELLSGFCIVQAGLADIKGWGQYMGAQWCGEGSDMERALEHSNQAVRYLISGKDDCVRKACKVKHPFAPAPACCILPHTGFGQALVHLSEVEGTVLSGFVRFIISSSS